MNRGQVRPCRLCGGEPVRKTRAVIVYGMKTGNRIVWFECGSCGARAAAADYGTFPVMHLRRSLAEAARIAAKDWNDWRTEDMAREDRKKHFEAWEEAQKEMDELKKAAGEDWITAFWTGYCQSGKKV